MENNKKNYVVISCLIILVLVSLLSLLIKKSDTINTTNSGQEYFHNYKVNEIQKVYVSIAEVSNIYLSELVSLVVNNPRGLYDILDSSTKDKYSNYNTVIASGSLFYNELLIEEENLPDSVFYNVPEGEVVVSFPVNTVSTYGNSIMPNNLINVYS